MFHLFPTFEQYPEIPGVLHLTQGLPASPERAVHLFPSGTLTSGLEVLTHPSCFTPGCKPAQCTLEVPALSSAESRETIRWFPTLGALAVPRTSVQIMQVPKGSLARVQHALRTSLTYCWPCIPDFSCDHTGTGPSLTEGLDPMIKCHTAKRQNTFSKSTRHMLTGLEELPLTLEPPAESLELVQCFTGFLLNTSPSFPPSEETFQSLQSEAVSEAPDLDYRRATKHQTSTAPSAGG